MERCSKRASSTFHTAWASPALTLLIFVLRDVHWTHIRRIAYTRAERSFHDASSSAVTVTAGGVEELLAPFAPPAAAAFAAVTASAVAAAGALASAGPACNSTSCSLCIVRNASMRFLNVTHSALSPVKTSIGGMVKLPFGAGEEAGGAFGVDIVALASLL